MFIDAEQGKMSPYTQTNNGVTVNKNGQTVSLILIDNTASRRLPNVTKDSIAENTEICQAEAMIQTKTQVEPGIAAVLQEAFCNGVGIAIAARQAGVPYDQYVQAISNTTINRGIFRTAQYVLPEAQY